MSDAEPVIAVDRLEKTYRSFFRSGRSISALRGVSLNTAPGEIFGLLGPNGAGKTTLIKILLGVVRASGGRATLFGFPAGSIAARQRVGYLPESLRIDRHHTAQSALRYYGKMSRLAAHVIAERVDPLLRLVGLEGRDREPVRRFSKGMYQRLGLAQALLHDPDLLILDEPTDGLDPVGRSEVRRLLLELKHRGKTIFLNSHILQEVELVCDRVAIMSKGEVRGIGSVEELTRNVGGQEVILDIAATVRDNDELTIQIRKLIEPIYQQATGALASLKIDSMPEGRCRVKVLCDEQPLVDASVDALRRANLSIIGLKTSRAALEDVFLSLVEPREAAEQTTSDAGATRR